MNDPYCRPVSFTHNADARHRHQSGYHAGVRIYGLLTVRTRRSGKSRYRRTGPDSRCSRRSGRTSLPRTACIGCYVITPVMLPPEHIARTGAAYVCPAPERGLLTGLTSNWVHDRQITTFTRTYTRPVSGPGIVQQRAYYYAAVSAFLVRRARVLRGAFSGASAGASTTGSATTLRPRPIFCAREER